MLLSACRFTAAVTMVPSLEIVVIFNASCPNGTAIVMVLLLNSLRVNI
jgi:hypothetical protein